MGTAFDVSGDDDELVGIVPRAVEHLFIGIQQRQQDAREKGTVPPEFKVNAQFMEVLSLNFFFIFRNLCTVIRSVMIIIIIIIIIIITNNTFKVP